MVASPVAEILAASRIDADEMINTMNADEFSKLAIGDVADALRFVPGVNVVEGQFAVIRGLEDRYSSTLYNFAPVPSPDPDRQSVQLDLFPSDIVSNLVVAKTFGPDLPSNSSGGSINVITHEYPEEFELKFSWGRRIQRQCLGEVPGVRGRVSRSARRRTAGARSRATTAPRSAAAASCSTASSASRGSSTTRSTTRPGKASWRRSSRRRCLNTRSQPCQEGDEVRRSGDLALGELSLSNGKYQLTESDRDEQFMAYGGLGFDLDEAGYHKIDLSTFYTHFDNELVQLEENGYLPNFDYSVLAQKQAAGDEILRPGLQRLRHVQFCAEDGAPDGQRRRRAWARSGIPPSPRASRSTRSATSPSTRSTGTTRWKRSRACASSGPRTTRRPRRARRRSARSYFFEPDDASQVPTEFPVSAEDARARTVRRGQRLPEQHERHLRKTRTSAVSARHYTRDITDALTIEVSTGGWWERATRDVDSTFLESPTIGGNSQFAILADTAEELGKIDLRRAGLTERRRTRGRPVSVTRETTNQSEREIEAWDFGTKATLWNDIDLLSGFRYEKIHITSNNGPFTGEDRFGAPAAFPETYLFFDRLDNPARGEVSRPSCPDGHDLQRRAARHRRSDRSRDRAAST